MKLHVLGTGHATVLKNYNNCFCIENNGKMMLVDAGGGNGILKQLAMAKIDINDIDCAFISHNHSDHLLGFAWIVRFVLQQGYMKGTRTKPFTIYGSKECLDAIVYLNNITSGKKLVDKYLDNKLFLHEIKDGQQENIIGLDFEFFDTLTTEMSQMAFYIKNEKFLFCGDMPLDERNIARFKNPNWLCLEAFCTENNRDKNKLPLTKHFTVAQAAQTANVVQPKNLILWHGEDDLDGKRQENYIKEAKQFFDGNIYAPNDLDVIEISKTKQKNIDKN